MSELELLKKISASVNSAIRGVHGKQHAQDERIALLVKSNAQLTRKVLDLEGRVNELVTRSLG